MPKLIGPKIKPDMKPGDFHLIANNENATIKCYDHKGKLVLLGGKKKLPCLATGINGPTSWAWGGSTPPGLYELGVLYVTKMWESWAIWNAYGKYCYDLVEMENQENERGRAGICLHTAGSKAKPNPLSPYQTLTPTLGCVRMHNAHLKDFILPLTHYRWAGFLRRRKNRVYISVFQPVPN